MRVRRLTGALMTDYMHANADKHVGIGDRRSIAKWVEPSGGNSGAPGWAPQNARPPSRPGTPRPTADTSPL
jgi:hypothetical protein